MLELVFSLNCGDNWLLKYTVDSRLLVLEKHVILISFYRQSLAAVAGIKYLHLSMFLDGKWGDTGEV